MVLRAVLRPSTTDEPSVPHSHLPIRRDGDGLLPETPSHCTFHSPIRIRYGAVHPTFWLSRLSACPLPSCPCLACLSFPSSRMTSVQALVCYIYSAPSARLSAASRITRFTTQRTPHPCYPTLDTASTEPKTHPPLLSPVLCCHCRSWPLDPSPGIGLSSLGITINQ